MKNLFVTYEQALALKELGFDEPCISKFEENYLCQDEGFDVCNEDTWLTNSKLHYHKKYCAAPLKQQVFKWFREDKNLIGEVHSYYEFMGGSVNTFGIMIRNKYGLNFIDTAIDSENIIFNTHEEAENACIDELIEIVKAKK